jgi:hypothetical protein
MCRDGDLYGEKVYIFILKTFFSKDLFEIYILLLWMIYNECLWSDQYGERFEQFKTDIF